MNSAHKRGPWSATEDAALLALVTQNGAHNWVKISNSLRSRTPKQCRERFHQNLKPTLNHDAITPEEGEMIERLVAEMGKRWAEIARRMPGRSDNSVKNWWNGGMNRRRRIMVRREANAARTQPGVQENTDQMSFAPPPPRPQRQILVPQGRPRIEQALVSPVHSEVSMPDSLGDAPSLVSDHGSHFSNSSPNNILASQRHLPVPDINMGDGWRPSYGNPISLDQNHSSHDRTPHSWNHYHEQPKHADSVSLSSQRLQQFAEVAARHHTIGGDHGRQYNTHAQYNYYPQQPLPSFNALMHSNAEPSMSLSNAPARSHPSLLPSLPASSGPRVGDVEQHSEVFKMDSVNASNPDQSVLPPLEMNGAHSLSDAEALNSDRFPPPGDKQDELEGGKLSPSASKKIDVLSLID